MAINALRDGFVKICFDTSLNIRGAKCRFVVEGQMLGGTANPDELVKITQVSCIDDQFGQGSIQSEALKLAVECCGNNAVELYALPRADPVDGVAAVYEWPITGPGGATTDGSIDIYAGEGRYVIDDLFIPSGTSGIDVAALIAAEFGADFPYTVTSSGGKIIFTAKNTGTIGNGLTVQGNWKCEQKTLPGNLGFGKLSQITSGEGAPEPLDYSALFGECCICCYALLSDDAALQKNLQDYFQREWDCSKPQCFGHAYVYNTGSLGQVLARDTNAAVFSRLAHGVNNPILPWMRVVAYAAQSCCLTVDNPEISIQGPNFGLLGCITAPEGCFPEWTQDELVQLEDAGFVVTLPATNGCGALTSPVVVNDITNNRFDDEGRLNPTFRDVSSRRLAVQTAISIAEKNQEFNGFGLYGKNTAIREGVQGTNSRLMLGELRVWAKSKVGELFSEFENLDRDLTLTESLDTSPRCQGEPGQLDLNLKYRPPVRIRGVDVNASPQLLTNC